MPIEEKLMCNKVTDNKCCGKEMLFAGMLVSKGGKNMTILWQCTCGNAVSQVREVK
jgi:DNA-directed RNA polymerase subunit M/transcription elongation factor TFIIS